MLNSFQQAMKIGDLRTKLLITLVFADIPFWSSCCGAVY